MRSCVSTAPSVRVRARCSRSIARASSPAPAATCRCSPRRRNSKAAPAGRVFTSRSKTPSAKPKTAPSGSCAPKFTAAVAAAISVTSSTTGRSRPACATALTASRWYSVRLRHRRPDSWIYRPAIVARPAIVPRSSDRGFLFKYLTSKRFLFWHSACDVLLRLRPRLSGRRAVRIEFGDDAMGIFDALNTSVAGLQAQSFALQNISGNIANAQTTGYKGVGTSFVDLVPDSTTPNRQVAGSVTAYARATISSQGTVSASTVATYMAINGDGFFSVQKATGITDNVPVFTGVTNYTRRGDFQVNANGNLVNGAGYYLMGVAVDPKTGNPLGNVPQVLQFQNNFIPAQTTTSINYAANLPSTPTTATSATSAAGTINALGGLNPYDFTVNPMPTSTPATPYGDNSVTGTAESNQAATPVPITAATTLSGASPSNSLSAGFAVGDTITVDGTTLTFIAG